MGQNSRRVSPLPGGAITEIGTRCWGETPHLEAGDEKERLGQWHRRGRQATGPVEGQYTETSARRRGVMRKGRGLLVLQEVRRKLEETLSGAGQGERPERQAGAVECGLGFSGHGLVWERVP